MNKRGPPRGLSISVDPSHRNITDASDRVPTGRIILTADAHDEKAGVKKSTTSSGQPSNIQPNALVASGSQPLLPSSSTSHALSQVVSPVRSSFELDSRGLSRNLKQLSLVLPTPAKSSPPSPSARTRTLSNGSNSVASTSQDVMSTLSRFGGEPSSRASSVSRKSHRQHPVLSDQKSVSGPYGQREFTRSSSSLASLSKTRAEEDGYNYATSSFTSGIAAPEPYLHGPIQILPGIWLGCEDNTRDWASLRRCGIGALVNVAKEIKGLFDDSTESQVTTSSSKSPASNRPTPITYPADPQSGRPALKYLHLPWSHGQPDLVQTGFPAAFEFVDSMVKSGKGVLIHCQCGVSRSATLAIALVMRASVQPDCVEELKEINGKMDPAYAYVKEKSVAVGPNMSLIYQLLDYEKLLSQSKPRSRSRSRAPSESSLSASTHYQSSIRPEDAGEDEQDSLEFVGLSEDERKSRIEAKEAERNRAEEEQWAKMRLQMEEEEERERQESLLAASLTQSTAPAFSNPWGSSKFTDSSPLPTSHLSVPWTSSWKTSSDTLSRKTSSVQDEEEARDLDRAMEERRKLRRQSSMASITSSASIASSNAHVQSETSSPSASVSGANFSLPPTSGASGWKSRLGHPRRLRAGSVESNFTGRSMVSLEEEDEEEDILPRTTDEDDSSRQRPKRQTTIRAPRDRKLSGQSASLSLRSIASVASARERTRSITLQIVGPDSQDVPMDDQSATQSPVSTTSSRGTDDWHDDDEMDRGVEVEVPSLSFAPFTGSSTSAVSTNVPTPMSAHMTLGAPPKKAKLSSGLSLSHTGDDTVRIAVPDSALLSSHISPSHSYPDHPSASLANLIPEENGLATVPPLLPFPKQRSSRSSLSIPPPSASAYKSSFGASELSILPSASSRKLAFNRNELSLPPPSSSAHKTSFGAMELQLPPSRPAKRHFPEPPSANPFKTSFGGAEIDAPPIVQPTPPESRDHCSNLPSLSRDTKQHSALPPLSVSSAEPVQERFRLQAARLDRFERRTTYIQAWQDSTSACTTRVEA